jgi:hypothetical protein
MLGIEQKASSMLGKSPTTNSHNFWLVSKLLKSNPSHLQFFQKIETVLATSQGTVIYSFLDCHFLLIHWIFVTWKHNNPMCIPLLLLLFKVNSDGFKMGTLLSCKNDM